MTSLSLVSVLVLLLGIPALAVSPTIRRLFRKAKVEDITPEWLEDFSVATYLPMTRLLSTEDFAFLASQPGFDAALYRKFRSDRLRIFRQYLHRMISDFNRLHLAARLLLSQAPQDESQLFGRLVLLKLLFVVSVLRVEIRYMLCKAGLQTVSVAALIQRLDAMSAQLAEMSAIEPARA